MVVGTMELKNFGRALVVPRSHLEERQKICGERGYGVLEAEVRYLASPGCYPKKCPWELCPWAVTVLTVWCYVHLK